jgi:hypothetical protein
VKLAIPDEFAAGFRSLPLYTGISSSLHTHLNPLRANVCGDMIEYRWSSARFWQDEKYVRDDYTLNIEATLREFSPPATLLEIASTDTCEGGPGP